MQTKTDAQGNLQIWTGTGWQTIPKIAASDLSFNAARRGEDQGVGDSATPGASYGPDVGFASSNILSKYGVGDFNGTSNNWQTSWDGSNKDAFNLLLKSGDKEGSQIKYTLKDGYYVPQATGAIPWDTNNGDQNMALLRMALMGASMGMLGPAFEAWAAGGMAPLGEGAVQALTSTPTLAEAGANALGTASTVGTALPYSEAFDAWQLAQQGLSQEAIIQNLVATGLDEFAAADLAQLALQGLSPEAIQQVGQFAQQGAPGVPPGTPPGAPPGSPSGAPPFEDNFPPGGPDLSGTPPLDLSNLPPWAKTLLQTFGPTALKGLIDYGIGASGREKSEDMLTRIKNDMVSAGNQYKSAYDTYGKGLRDMAPGMLQQYQYRPATVNNGFATSFVDPVTGQVSNTLNPEYALARGKYLSAAENVMDQARDFNPQTFAKERYAAMQGLLAPTREKQQQDLMQTLNNKGAFGLSLNTPTQNGTQGINPYVNALSSGWAQEDKQMAYDSLNQGEKYLDNLLGRQKGLFGSATDLTRAGERSMDSAMNWGNTFTNSNRSVADMNYGIQKDALSAERQGTTQFIDNWLKAQNGYNGQMGAAAGAGANSFGNVVDNLPWGDIWDKLSKQFGWGSNP